MLDALWDGRQDQLDCLVAQIDGVESHGASRAILSNQLALPVYRAGLRKSAELRRDEFAIGGRYQIDEVHLQQFCVLFTRQPGRGRIRIKETPRQID
jgi:hypothetical protein